MYTQGKDYFLPWVIFFSNTMHNLTLKDLEKTLNELGSPQITQIADNLYYMLPQGILFNEKFLEDLYIQLKRSINNESYISINARNSFGDAHL